MKYFTWFSMPQEINTPAGIRKVVRITSHRLMPSTPRRYLKFNGPTQVARSTSWNPGCPPSYAPSRPRANPNVTRVTASAHHRWTPLARDGMAIAITPPTAGMNVTTDSHGKWSI